MNPGNAVRFFRAKDLALFVSEIHSFVMRVGGVGSCQAAKKRNVRIGENGARIMEVYAGGSVRGGGGLSGPDVEDNANPASWGREMISKDIRDKFFESEMSRARHPMTSGGLQCHQRA